MVRDTQPSVASASLSVSLSGTAATAPSPVRAARITPSMVARSTNGRAPSCTRTMLHSSRSTPSALRTDSPRLSPPETIERASPSSIASHSGGAAACAAGSAITTCATSGCDTNGRTARSSIGTPAISRYCLSTPPPRRSPRPPATTSTPTSRGKGTNQLSDVIDRYQLHARHLHRASARRKDPPEPEAARLGHPALHAGRGPDLPAQPDLADEDHVGRGG